MNTYCFNCMEPIGPDGVCRVCGHINGMEVVNPHQLKPGTKLNNRYLLGRVIGQGGFGITYVGRDLLLELKVAVKEYYPNGHANRNTEASEFMTVAEHGQKKILERGKQRFLEEARVLASLHNAPGVVDVRDFFEANNTAYIIMEFLEGDTLRKYLERRRFDPNTIFDRFLPMMRTLDTVHAKGVIHRDISPENIMILNNGQLKLLDFGAAREMRFDDPRSMSIMLKSGYAPEEQYRPKGEQGPWTDVYAFCATIYKCITGITPEDALERMHVDTVRWPSELGINIQQKYELVLRKGMAIMHQARFQNFRELERALNSDAITRAIATELLTARAIAGRAPQSGEGGSRSVPGGQLQVGARPAGAAPNSKAGASGAVSWQGHAASQVAGGKSAGQVASGDSSAKKRDSSKVILVVCLVVVAVGVIALAAMFALGIIGPTRGGSMNKGSLPVSTASASVASSSSSVRDVVASGDAADILESWVSESAGSENSAIEGTSSSASEASSDGTSNGTPEKGNGKYPEAMVGTWQAVNDASEVLTLFVNDDGSAIIMFPSGEKYRGSWTASGDRTGRIHLPGNYYSYQLSSSGLSLRAGSYAITFQKAK